MYTDHSLCTVDRAETVVSQSESQDECAESENQRKNLMSKENDGASSNLSRSDEATELVYDSNRAWGSLHKTVLILKEAGNEALKTSSPSLAARRHDKAINYCSVAFLNFTVREY